MLRTYLNPRAYGQVQGISSFDIKARTPGLTNCEQLESESVPRDTANPDDKSNTVQHFFNLVKQELPACVIARNRSCL